MAAPTSTVTVQPNYVIAVTGTSVDAGNNDYVLDYNQANLSRGFSIITGTLTAMTVTILADNGAGVNYDATADFCGPAVTTLASNTMYMVDIKVPVKTITIRATRSNAVNAINFIIFAAKR